MARFLLVINMILLLLAGSFMGYQYLQYMTVLTSLEPSVGSTLAMNPRYQGLTALNYYSLMLTDDMELSLDSDSEIGDLSDEELAAVEFRLTFVDSLSLETVTLTRASFTENSQLQIIDNDEGTTTNADIQDLLFQINYVESYRSRRPIYSISLELTDGEWLISNFNIGI